MTTATLDVKHDGHVARVYLNRPDVRNAFNEGSMSPTGQVLHSVVVRESLMQAAERYGWKEAR